MSNSHTPGPWRVGRHFTDDEGYREIAIEASVRGVDVVPASVVLPFPNLGGMQEANACLIAAAPELLEALQRLHRWAQAASPACEFAGDHPIAVARAAITKATGETPC